MLETYFDTVGLTGGILIVLLVGILIFLGVAVAMESKTRQLFPDRKKSKDEESFFDFGDDEDEDDD